MKQRTSVTRIISLLLSLVIVIGLTPVITLATDSAPEVKEVVALREENVKHYDMGDGTFQAVAFSHPIHELDGNGSWQDINFSLDITRAEGTRTYSNSLTGSTFAATYTPNQPLMTLSSGNTGISMTLDTSSSAAPSTFWSRLTPTVTADITTAQPSLSTPDAAKTASFSNKLLYKDVLPSVDLEYILDPGMVKENIIVNEKLDDYEYIFTLDLDGLYPVMQDSGSVIVYNSDTNTPEYEIPAPYMYDASGNMSTEVFYTLTGTGDTYTLTVTADTDWINTEGRSFPVTIDPSYVVNSPTVYDTYIDSNSPDTVHGSDSLLYVRGNRITYIKAPIPTIPDYGTLEWATLTAYYYYFDYVSSGSVGVSAHRVNTYWSENTLTWNSIKNTSNYGLSTAQLDSVMTYANIGATVNNPQKVDFSITSAVNSWFNGTNTNNGIALKYISNSVNLSVVFKSSESSADYRPRITYSYSIGGDSFISALVNTYGFTASEASLIKTLYTKVDSAFPNNTALHNAWISSRLLGGFVYGGELSFHETTSTIKWADVAGLVVYSSEEDYFIDTLGFTHIQYTELKNAVEYQHAQAYYADEGDFAHMQISLAARLAYKLGRTGILSNVYGGNETVSYLAGWLGDATLTNNGTTYFGNDDYIADLDAENIFRLLLNGNSITAASTTYFSNLSSSTRAQIFKNHISYTTAKSMIYYQLIDKVLYAQIDLAAAEGDLITVTYLQSLLEDVEYHEAQIANNYPDTHDFLLSLYSGLNEMGDY